MECVLNKQLHFWSFTNLSHRVLQTCCYLSIAKYLSFIVQNCKMPLWRHLSSLRYKHKFIVCSTHFRLSILTSLFPFVAPLPLIQPYPHLWGFSNTSRRYKYFKPGRQSQREFFLFLIGLPLTLQNRARRAYIPLPTDHWIFMRVGNQVSFDTLSRIILGWKVTAVT